MGDKIYFSNKSQERDYYVGFIVRRHTYIDKMLDQIIILSLAKNRKNLFKKIFLEKKTIGLKIGILEILDKEKVFKKSINRIIKSLKEFNDKRNSILHEIIKYPLDIDKSPNMERPFVKTKKGNLELSWKELELINVQVKEIYGDLYNLQSELLLEQDKNG